MKTDRIIRQSVILFICTMTVFIPLPALAWDKAAIDKAESFYNQGIADYNRQHWSDAAWNFDQSFQIIPHSMTAYMLGATYIELEKPGEALRWAETATSSKPDLQEPYISGVNQIIGWARTAKNDPYYIRGKADEMNRPPAPKVNPPRPSVPQNTKWVIAPSTPHRAPPAHGNSILPLFPVQPIPGAGQSDLQIRNVSISPNPLVQSQIQLHMYRSYRLQVRILNSGAPSPAFTVLTECNRNGIHYKLGETHVKPIRKNQTRDVFYDIFPGEAGAGGCMMRTTVDADQQVKESHESPLSNSWDRAVTILP